MIKSFKCGETRLIFERQGSRRLPGEIQKVALRKLVAIHAALQTDDLRIPPGNRIEALKGKRKGQHCIRINDQWRICFRFENGDAYEVEIADYH
ncbi:MAG: type II toxin-antitoxin system RelE/ParE family toxin [Verrucomicrobiae bacterium]|nr:type II toxin-antitoxin system RelE/ParE family toxin [Verrucomicrobiae bacterium]